MRFSLKRVLAATVYAAIAAAAFSQETWIYADLLWLATFVTLTYALACAFFARGISRACGGGYAIAALLYFAAQHFAADSLPTERLVTALLISPSANNPPLPPNPTFSIAPGGAVAVQVVRDLSPSFHAAHALAAMALGLAGSALGRAAYRKHEDAKNLCLPADSR